MNTLWSQRPVRAAGERPTVISLHAAAGTPEQWWPLAERLRLRYRVLAPELHGYAAGRASGAHPPLSLEAEAARIEPLLDAFPGPVYLVGHDYGAAVALKLAHRRRERIAGLVLYEPTLFGCRPGHRGPAARARALSRGGRLVPGRSTLCGPSLGRGRLAGPVNPGAGGDRPSYAGAMRADAQCADPTPLAGYARIDVPVWLLTGARPRAATERIARLLAGTFPRAVWRRIDSADRMGPVSRPEALDREIEGFLAQQQASWHRDPEPTAAFGRPIFGALRHARELAEAASL